MGITVMGGHQSLPENPSADDVVSFMKNSKTNDEWDNRIDEVKAKFGGKYPDFWYEKIIVPGIGPNNKNEDNDIKLITVGNVNRIFNPIKELGKKEDVLPNIHDLQQITIYGRPTKMPVLIQGYSFICGYDQGVGERMFVCNVLEGAQTLYDKYAQGWAINIKRYVGKIKEE